MPQPADKFSNLQPNEPQPPEALQRSEHVNSSNKIFFRLPRLYIPFYQAMAEDCPQHGQKLPL